MKPSCLIALAATLWACSSQESSSGSECIYNSECAAHQMCAQGRCVDECVESRDCAAGSCVNGACVAPGDQTDADAGGSESDTPDETADLGPRPFGTGSIEGMVHFRLHDDTILPVAEPVVYWTYPEDPPEPLAAGASCDCGFPGYAVTGRVNGTFSLSDVPAGWVYLVVQKGNFRRYRLIEVAVGDTVTAPAEMTELPARSDPENGDQVPRIAIGTGRFDSIEDVFAKLRMGPITNTWGFDHERYMENPDAWGVDLMVYQQPRDMEDTDRELVAPDFLDLFLDLPSLLDYHIVFAPCAEESRYGALLTSESVRNNVRDFVYGGGKLYVTDYAYDVLEQPFPRYIDFSGPGGDGNADGHVGDPSFMGIATDDTWRYASDNRAEDPNLGSWLIAIDASDDGTLVTQGNWVNINRVDAVSQCCNQEGEWVDVLPQVVTSGPNYYEPLIGQGGPSHETWEAAATEGANHPHTVRFSYGCGQTMYSTYHTVETSTRSATLHPQELVLLYLILEIGECIVEPIKEP